MKQITKKAYILIGDSNAGKSSTIRCLTGVFRQGERIITASDLGNIRLFVKPTSIQEAQWSMETLIKALEGYDFCLIALRTEGWGSAPNSAEDYIDTLMELGWDVQMIYFDTNTPEQSSYFNQFNANEFRFLPRDGRQINEIAREVRSYFNLA